MKNKYLIILIIIFTCIIPQEIKPQNKNQNNWVDFGISQAFSKDNLSYVNIGANVNWQSSALFHSAGLYFTSGLFSSINWSFAVNYGIGYSFNIKKIMISSISLGPSLSFGETRQENNYYSKFFWGTGISINAQLYLSPLFFIIPEVGLGIEPYFNYDLFESKRTNMPYIYGIRFAFNINDNN